MGSTCEWSEGKNLPGFSFLVSPRALPPFVALRLLLLSARVVLSARDECLSDGHAANRLSWVPFRSGQTENIAPLTRSYALALYLSFGVCHADQFAMASPRSPKPSSQLL